MEGRTGVPGRVAVVVELEAQRSPLIHQLLLFRVNGMVMNT